MILMIALALIMTMTMAMMMMMMMVVVARAEIGASSVGTGFYEACLAFHTTTNKVSAHAPAFIMMMIRGDVKYYFADFVRKGGTRTKVSLKNRLRIFGVPPFTDKIFSEKGVTDLGGTPTPLYGQNPQSNI